MSLSRWKMMAGVLGVSIGGLAAAASQCPKLDKSKGRSPESPVAKAEPKLAPAGAPSAPAPTLEMPAVPAAPVLLPAAPTPPAVTMPLVDVPQTPAAPSGVLPPVGAPAAPAMPELTVPKPAETKSGTPLPPPAAPTPGGLIPLPSPTKVADPVKPPTPVFPVGELVQPAPKAEPLPPPVKPAPAPKAEPLPPQAELGFQVPLNNNEPSLPIPSGTGSKPAAPIVNISGATPAVIPAATPPAPGFVPSSEIKPSPAVDVPLSKPTFAPAAVATAPAVVESKFRILLRVGEGEPTFEVKNGDNLVLKVACEKVDIESVEKTNGLSKVTARGKVRFAGFGAEGSCDTLSFMAGTGEVSMAGDVKVQVKDKLGRVESELTTATMKYRIDASSVGGALKP